MLHFNRKTEYALLALEHMYTREGQNGSITSTREVSEAYHIPYPLLAKVMQKLAGKGLVRAVHGTKGGYSLAKRPMEISVSDVVGIFEGPIAVTECIKEGHSSCPQLGDCSIKDPFQQLNQKIAKLLTETTLNDLVGRSTAVSKPAVIEPL